jgi:hypothetical protein
MPVTLLVFSPRRHVAWQHPARGGATTFDVESPATGEVIAQVADADSIDWFAALDRAVSAQEQ